MVSVHAPGGCDGECSSVPADLCLTDLELESSSVLCSLEISKL